MQLLSPLVGVTVACMHHDTNSMRSIGTCTDSVWGVYNKLSFIFLLSEYIKLVDKADGETHTTDADLVCCIDVINEYQRFFYFVYLVNKYKFGVKIMT